MEEYKVTLILAVIAAAPGVLAIILQRRKNISDASKTDADANSVVVDTVLKIIEPLRKECEALGKEKAALQVALDECHAKLKHFRQTGGID